MYFALLAFRSGGHDLGSKRATSEEARDWPVLRGFAGWKLGSLGPDIIAGLTLAAVAIPEQMATARLAGFGPEKGFLASCWRFGLRALRRQSVHVGRRDSTIAPIFAGALAALAAAGAPDYAADAAALALGVEFASPSPVSFGSVSSPTCFPFQ